MTHIVRPGDSLSAIAIANGITLEELLDANPQFKADPDIIHPGDVVTIPGDEPETPAQPLAAPSAFADRLASVARGLHERLSSVNEADPELCAAIKRWTEGIGATFVSCTSNNHPWSAVFVSWCVKEAGATAAEFKFSTQHSVFVHKAIKDADTGTGVFHGLRISDHAPNVGDIVHHNRGGATFTFDDAKRSSDFPSHSVIVVDIGEDEMGRFALCIGGNESDSVRTTKVRLTSEGFVRPRGRNPFICVIQTLKP